MQATPEQEKAIREYQNPQGTEAVNLNLYKIVCRDRDTGKVVQIHEVYGTDVPRYVMAELDKDRKVTIDRLER